MISVKQVLKIMQIGEPFSIEVLAFDRNRKQGGKVKWYPEAVLMMAEESEKTKKSAASGNPVSEKIRKDPHHFNNYTRNIRILQEGHPTGQVLTIHPPLITKFNNKTVAT